MTEFTDMGVSDLADLIKNKQASPVEITSAFLSRIDAVNGRLNAFVTVDAEGALAAAKAAEAEIQGGGYLGPLHGVPVAYKDLYATAGMRTTGGSRVLEDNVPDKDATVVARLRQGGAINLGKTNTHEFAYGPTNEVSLFGPVKNPWNTDRVSGGSSGGSGSAVAAGLVPIASGSDTGGSIRIPAACCGLTGLKPTYGRVSRAGILPLCWTLDHAGPLARSALDAALFLEVIAGHDPRDDASSDRPVPNYGAELTGDVSGIRIGVPRALFFDRAADAVTGRVDEALAVLEGLGAKLVPVDIPYVDHAAAAAMAIYLAEATAYHDDTLDDRADLYSESVRTFLELGDQILAKDYIHAQRFRTLLGKEMSKVFENVDVLATPGTPITATPMGCEIIDINGTDDSVFGALLRNTEPFNLSGLPAIVAPCGSDDDGMPVSLQIVGPAFQEGLVLNVIHGYQTATEWHRQRPLLAP
jgi:aspartyl-tRNA(Asn)/glutamyl-tRNA(Gln) amidotransferase subunit A